MDDNNLKLSKRINKLDLQDRFSLFEISNFLDEDTFAKLNLSFPDSKFFSTHSEFAKSFTDENENFYDFLENNLEWKILYDKLNSSIFVEDLIRFFSLRNVYFSENSWKKNIRIFKKVKLSFCFNISDEGGYSLPHTDSSRKLLSMVLFFVDKTWSEKNGGQVKLYKPKFSMFENNWRNERVNKKNLDVIKTIIPSPNKIYGFKKTKNSYHSVEPVKFINSLSRKVLMINLIYEKKSDSPYTQKLTILEKVKNMIYS
tara:strand:+ start:197 stop:967 length:771 start_codon:yes stop_codon:yes gene_type:complete